MSGKKLQVFCKIIDFIQDQDEEFADIIRATCNDVVLNATRNKPGITFLMPEKKYREEIANLAYSSDIAEAAKASEMIQSLILSGAYENGAQMKEDPFLANCLMTPQVVEVEKVDGGKVHFKSGAIAERDMKFKCTRDKFFVWKLTGKLPIRTKDAPRRDFVKKPAMKKGTAKHGSYESDFSKMITRNKIMVAIENIYLSHELQRRTAGIKVPDVYFLYTCSLLSYLHEQNREVFEQMMLEMSLDKTDLYFLIEPHTDGNYKIDGQIIDDWWAKNADYQKIDPHCSDCISKWLEDSKTERKNKLTQRENELKNISKSPNMALQLQQAYKKLYPEDSDKIVRDEARYVASVSFKRFENAPNLDTYQFHNIVNYLGDLLHDHRNVLINHINIQSSIRPVNELNALETFIEGSWALYVPACTGEVKNHRKQPTDRAMLMDIPKMSKTHNRLITDPAITVDEIMKVIGNQDAKFLDHLRSELKTLNK